MDNSKPYFKIVTKGLNKIYCTVIYKTYKKVSKYLFYSLNYK